MEIEKRKLGAALQARELDAALDAASGCSDRRGVPGRAKAA